jgi:hypothetical protein
MFKKHIAGPAFAIVVLFALAVLTRLFEERAPQPATIDRHLTRDRIVVVDGDVPFGPYRFRPSDGTTLQFPQDDMFSTHALLIDGGLRWMTKADEGPLPSGARPIYVIAHLRSEPVTTGPPAPTLRAFGALELVRHTRPGATFRLAGTHDAEGDPIRIECNLDPADAHVLDDGTFETMRTDYCWLFFSPAHDVHAWVQTYPARMLGEAERLVPAFYEYMARDFTPGA